MTRAGPYCVLPLGRDLYSKTSLGKVSRAKMRTAFETGAFDMYEKSDFDQLSSLQTAQREKPSTQMERGLLSIFAEVLEAWQSEIGINTSLFGLGSRCDLLRRQSTRR